MVAKDSIFIQELKTNATIGIHDWEKQRKQPILLDLAFTTDITGAATSDDIAQTVDYKQVADRVIQLVEASSFELIETLATAVANLILTEFDIQTVKVTLYKPEAVPAAKTVGVCIERTRSSGTNT